MYIYWFKSINSLQWYIEYWYNVKSSRIIIVMALKIYDTRQESPMIHSASPQSRPAVIFAWFSSFGMDNNLSCLKAVFGASQIFECNNWSCFYAVFRASQLFERNGTSVMKRKKELAVQNRTIFLLLLLLLFFAHEKNIIISQASFSASPHEKVKQNPLLLASLSYKRPCIFGNDYCVWNMRPTTHL